MPPAKKAAPAAKKAAAPAKRGTPVKSAAPAARKAAEPVKEAAAKRKAAPKAPPPQKTITLKQIAAEIADNHDVSKKRAAALLGDLSAAARFLDTS